jgi:hypothetical protein
MSDAEHEYDETLSAQEEDLHRSNRAARLRNLAMVLLATLALLFGAFCAWLAYDNNRLAAANAQYGAEQAQEKKIIAKEAQTALCGTKDSQIYDKAICEKLAEVAEEPAPPVAVPPVPGGPSQEELVKAFREYCAEGNCKGKDGAPPTADEIAAAFMKFCADGRCTGPAGKDAPPATDGKDGAPGTAGRNGVDGESLPPSPEMVLAAVTTYCGGSGACVGPAGVAGPPPTAEAVLAAVQQVCADNACVGPAGPAGPAGADSTVPGPQGPQGEQGPAPSSFTFTDRTGTTYTCTPNPPGSTTYACDPSGPPPPVIGVNP